MWGEPGNEGTWWFVVVFSTGASEPHYQGSVHGLQSYTNEDHTHYVNFCIELYTETVSQHLPMVTYACAHSLYAT